LLTFFISSVEFIEENTKQFKTTNNSTNNSKTSPSPTKTRNLDLGFPSMKNYNGQIQLVQFGRNSD